MHVWYFQLHVALLGVHVAAWLVERLQAGGLMDVGLCCCCGCCCRAKDERGALTSRVSGVGAVKSKVAESIPISNLPSFTTNTSTTRQGGVYGRTSSTGTGTSGAVTSRGAATSRGGSRWK